MTRASWRAASMWAGSKPLADPQYTQILVRFGVSPAGWPGLRLDGVAVRGVANEATGVCPPDCMAFSSVSGCGFGAGRFPSREAANPKGGQEKRERREGMAAAGSREAGRKGGRCDSYLKTELSENGPMTAMSGISMTCVHRDVGQNPCLEAKLGGAKKACKGWDNSGLVKPAGPGILIPSSDGGGAGLMKDTIHESCLIRCLTMPNVRPVPLEQRRSLGVPGRAWPFQGETLRSRAHNGSVLVATLG